MAKKNDEWAPESPLTALERSMNALTPNSAERFDGQIDSELDETPPGRTAVTYGGDPLFSPELQKETDEGEGADLDGLNGNLMQLLGDPMSALGSGSGGVLVAQLEVC